jgi:hypothetical protein
MGDQRWARWSRWAPFVILSIPKGVLHFLITEAIANNRARGLMSPERLRVCRAAAGRMIHLGPVEVTRRDPNPRRTRD